MKRLNIVMTLVALAPLLAACSSSCECPRCPTTTVVTPNHRTSTVVTPGHTVVTTPDYSEDYNTNYNY